MNKHMKKTLSLLAVLIIIAAGAYWVQVYGLHMDTAPDGSSTQPVPAAGHVVMQGVMVCLPHKDTTGPQTMECAYGLKDDYERYFGISDTDPTYANIMGVPMNERVEVEGNFVPRSDSKYQDIGIIHVTRITRLNSVTPSPTPKPAPSTSGGGVTITETTGEFWGSIQGTVLLGPTCPVESYPPDPNCADRPFQTQLVVTSADQSKVIREFSSKADGTFSVEVPPGQYAIRSAAVANILPYCASNGTITVKANDYTEANVSCDSGIR